MVNGGPAAALLWRGKWGAHFFSFIYFHLPSFGWIWFDRRCPTKYFRRGKARKAVGEEAESNVTSALSHVGFFPPEWYFTADIADIADKSMFSRFLTFFLP